MSYPRAKAGIVTHESHHLKITDGWWQALLFGGKTCEIRRNDRDFRPGDFIHFTNLLGEHRNGLFKITHVVTDVDGIEPGYAVLSVKWVSR